MSVHRRTGNGRLKASRRLWPKRLNGRGLGGVLPLERRLQAIGDRVAVSEIDELWVFPPLPDREMTSEFIVISCYDGPGRRRIVTAHVEIESRDPETAEITCVQHLEEHGAAPEGWVSGIPDRLLQRLSDAGVPEAIEIGGSPERWLEAIRSLTGSGNGTVAANGSLERAGAGGSAGSTAGVPVEASAGSDADG